MKRAFYSKPHAKPQYEQGYSIQEPYSAQIQFSGFRGLAHGAYLHWNCTHVVMALPWSGTNFQLLTKIWTVLAG